MPVTTSRGRLGVANAVAGASISAFGHFLQRWARQRSTRDPRGLDPLSRRAYYETRIAVSVGLLCVACGLVSGVVGDALLPLSAQAPLAALTAALRVLTIAIVSPGGSRGLRSRDSGESFLLGKGDEGPLDYEGSTPSSEDIVAPLSRRQLQVSLFFMTAGPSVALLGARLDDPGGMNAKAVAAAMLSPQTLASAGVSVSSSIFSGRTLASSALTSALASAWAHAAIKASVELAMYYHGLGSLAVWAALLTVPVFVVLKLRAVAKGLNAHAKDIYMPVYQALAIVTNAACGILVFDDFGCFSPPERRPREADGLEPFVPSLVFTQVAAYVVGVGCAVFGVLLTVPDFSAAGDTIAHHQSVCFDQERDFGYEEEEVRWRLVEEDDAESLQSNFVDSHQEQSRRLWSPFVVDGSQLPEASPLARESWDAAAAETSTIQAALPMQEEGDDDRLL